jgi:hypothetical protein
MGQVKQHIRDAQAGSKEIRVTAKQLENYDDVETVWYICDFDYGECKARGFDTLNPLESRIDLQELCESLVSEMSPNFHNCTYVARVTSSTDFKTRGNVRIIFELKEPLSLAKKKILTDNENARWRKTTSWERARNRFTELHASPDQSYNEQFKVLDDAEKLELLDSSIHAPGHLVLTADPDAHAYIMEDGKKRRYSLTPQLLRQSREAIFVEHEHDVVEVLPEQLIENADKTKHSKGKRKSSGARKSRKASEGAAAGARAEFDRETSEELLEGMGRGKFHFPILRIVASFAKKTPVHRADEVLADLEWIFIAAFRDKLNPDEVEESILASMARSWEKCGIARSRSTGIHGRCDQRLTRQRLTISPRRAARLERGLPNSIGRHASTTISSPRG